MRITFTLLIWSIPLKMLKISHIIIRDTRWSIFIRRDSLQDMREKYEKGSVDTHFKPKKQLTVLLNLPSVPKNSQNPVRWVSVSTTLKFSRSVSEREPPPSNFAFREWVSRWLTHAHSRLTSHFFEIFQKKFFWLKNHYFDLFNLSWPTKWTKQSELNGPNDASSRQNLHSMYFLAVSFELRFFPFSRIPKKKRMRFPILTSLSNLIAILYEIDQ